MTDLDRNRLAALCREALAWDYRHAGELATLLNQCPGGEQRDAFVQALDTLQGDERRRLEEAFTRCWQEQREFVWEETR
jgi:hypothetical protein